MSPLGSAATFSVSAPTFPGFFLIEVEIFRLSSDFFLPDEFLRLGGAATFSGSELTFPSSVATITALAGNFSDSAATFFYSMLNLSGSAATFSVSAPAFPGFFLINVEFFRLGCDFFLLDVEFFRLFQLSADFFRIAAETKTKFSSSLEVLKSLIHSLVLLGT